MSEVYFWIFKDDLKIIPSTFPTGPFENTAACLESARTKREEFFDDDFFNDEFGNKEDYDVGEEAFYGTIIIYSAVPYVPTLYGVELMSAFDDYIIENEFHFSDDRARCFDSVNVNHIYALYEHMNAALKEFVEKTNCFCGLHILTARLGEYVL